MPLQNLMAKALYDNVPESPEELAFRKGDILTVIEQNTGGLEGWWLCSLHGRQGIAPGNRLKLLIGPMFEAQPSAAQSPPQSLQKGGSGAQGLYKQQQGIYQVPGGQDVYQVPPRSTLAAEGTPSKVVTPTRVGQSYSYGQQDLYDVPPSRSQGVGVTSPPRRHDQFWYRPEPAEPEHPRLFSGSTAIISQSFSFFFFSFLRKLPEPMSGQTEPRSSADRGVYDVPAQDGRAVADVTDGVNRLSFSSTGSTRSSMSTSSSSTGSEGRLFLDVDAGVQRLYRLQQGVELAVGALQSMASSAHWRTFAFMERHANEVRGALDRVRAALGDAVAFGRGAAANATASLSDSGLQGKLRRQLGRLEDSQQILQQTYQALESGGWALNALASSRQHHAKSDDLDRFVMVSRTLPDDAKQLASTIGSNAELLFRRTHGDGTFSAGGTPEDNRAHALSSPSSEPDDYGGPGKAQPDPDKDNMNHSEKCVKSWMEDYDYVHLQVEVELLRRPRRLRLTQSAFLQIKQFRKLEQEVIRPVENDITQWIPPADAASTRVGARDRQLLGFYSTQCEQHFSTLLSAVDAFFACVRAGQPPRIFVAHSKFVILSAHKLVFIGDTLSRQAAAPEVANRVMNSSNVLCDLLKTVVAATKTAALNYPNTAAIQEMVDRVTDLSHHAQHFNEQLLQMAAL
uniref:Neural precursor cell expressed, developmentally down-regulated 9 n=1 Tax=Fundulus heteroclitus TaxID=8078 RepID=A0A3Q2PIF2_FUNHE